MTVKAQRVSKKSDNTTWCRPTEGYSAEEAMEIELSQYEEVDTVQGELPVSDQMFPKGAPWEDHAKVGDKILKKLP